MDRRVFLAWKSATSGIDAKAEERKESGPLRIKGWNLKPARTDGQDKLGKADFSAVIVDSWAN